MHDFLLRYKYLFLIVGIAALLRMYQIGQVPPSPDWDEVALGWNALSILETGRDEYGKLFPLSLRSFDDYKPPLYMYVTVPFVALFGLDTWVVRLPSALIGTSAVFAVFFLIKELHQYQTKKEKNEVLAYLVSFLLAISPWHIQFSRIAFEANIGVGITIWAVTLFLLGLRKKNLLPISAFLFAFSLYAYHSQRIFTPLLCIILFLSFRKKLWENRKAFLFSIVVGLLTLAPLIPVFTDKTTLTRLQGTSALSDQTRLLERSVQKLERDRTNNNLLGFIFDNRRIVFGQKLIEGYLSHYSLRWLFITGDNERHHAPGMGLMYVWELPFLLIGLYSVIKRGGIFSRVIFGWFLIAPIAASPTTELPHGIRTLVFLPTLQVFVAYGLWDTNNFIRKRISFLKSGIIYSFFALFVLFNSMYYLDMYFHHMSAEYSSFWQYGYKQAVEYAEKNRDQYKKIVVSTKLEQPHMFFLFYLRYDPSTYLQDGGTASGGFKEVKNRFDIYEFRPIEWEKEIKDGSILYIGTPGEIPGTAKEVIHYLNGKEAIKISP